MAKYMEPVEKAYDDFHAAVHGIEGEDGQKRNDTGRDEKGNKARVLRSIDDFGRIGREVVASVRANWMASAAEKIGKLGMSITVEVVDANKRGLIVPPLEEEDLLRLGGQRTLFAQMAESVPLREASGPTPTAAIVTDEPKP